MKQSLIILALILCLGLASATNEIDIFITNGQPIAKNTPHIIYFQTINATQTITSASCKVNLFDLSNNNIFNEFGILSGDKYKVILDKNNFTSIGSYPYIITCNTSGQTGGIDGNLEVTLNGNDKPDSLLIIFFSIIFLMLLAGATTSLLNNIGHWVDLEVDLYDVALSFSIYFIVFAFYYLVKTFLGDTMIQDITLMMVYVGGISHILVPIYSLAASMIWNPLKVKERGESMSWN
jgi:hypothetical protein